MKQFRTSANLVKKFGSYYWQSMTSEEFKERERTYFKVLDDIHCEKDIARFMAQEHTKRFQIDNVQHDTFFVPNYNEKEAAYIFKIQHCFADGLALINFMHTF